MSGSGCCNYGVRTQSKYEQSTIIQNGNYVNQETEKKHQLQLDSCSRGKAQNIVFVVLLFFFASIIYLIHKRNEFCLPVTENVFCM